MELIYRRIEGNEIREGYLRNFEADFEITTDVENPKNDFEIQMDLPKDTYDLLWKENEIACILYVNGTEWGGIIMDAEINMADSRITYTGFTWRGLLSGDIIEPPSGQDYRIVASGTNVATALRALPMNPYISIQDTSLVTSRQFQYNRYIPVHEGATNMLLNSNANWRLYFAYDETSGKALLTVGTTNDRTELIEISQDYDDYVSLIIKYDGYTPKHLICLGRGELKDREVIHLYADENWNISTTPISGAFPVEIYDYGSSESLLADGQKKFRELIENHTSLEVSVDGIDLNLGDIIAARERLTGIYITAEITRIIWKCKDDGSFQTESFEYSTAIKTKTVESGGKA